MNAARAIDGRAGDLPPEFDAAFYRANNPDLAALADLQLADHFMRWGAAEGRRASALADRDAFIAMVAARESGRVLEVGPGSAPVLSGAKIRYLDALDTVALRRNGGAPPRIHYVGKVDALPRSFDAAVACRSIGHHPDLVDHLQAIGRVLIEGGHYYLIVPDARYTPAVLMPRATIAAVVAAHHERRRRHAIGDVIAARALRVDDDIAARWKGEALLPSATVRTRRIAAAIEEHEIATDYLDVEAWHFTPDSFRDVTAILFELGLSPLAPVRVWTTPHLRDEFCAILVRP